MANDSRAGRRHDRGFTLIEMMIVVLIIGIMVAVGMPAIGRYVRNYRISGAARDVAGELQTARSRAIMSNTNNGVSFVVVDADSYRIVQEDRDPAEQLGLLKTLPSGIRFVDVGGQYSLRFQRLGGYCSPGSGTCAAPVGVVCSGPEAAGCSWEPLAGFVGPDGAQGLQITLLETTTGLRKAVRIAVGGRVTTQEGYVP